MITKNSCEGMIFLLYDKCSPVADSKHNYIILGTNDQNDKLGLLQCMAITSMRKKEITLEVPILLSNGMISYIVPYNIHSFSNQEVDLKNFKGCIADTEYISKYEFMQLLIDLYAYSMDLALVDAEEVIKRYETYCSEFWNVHSNHKEFRDYEQSVMNKAYNAPLLTSYPEEVAEKITTTQIEVHSAIKLKQPKRKGTNKSYSKKFDRHSKESARRKQEKMEQREFNEMVKSVTGKNILTEIYDVDAYEEVSCTEEQEAVADSCDIMCETEDQNAFKIPFSEEKISFNTIKLEQLSVLNETPRASKDFSDAELVLFLEGYEKYKYEELKTVIPDKWNSPNSFKNFYMSVKKEAIERKIIPPDNTGMMPDNKLARPCSEWSDNDLRQYLELSNNHKQDMEFMLQFTGYDDINSVNRRTYQVRKEAVSRNIIKL